MSHKRKSSPTTNQPAKVIRKEENDAKDVGNAVAKAIQECMPGLLDAKLNEFLPLIVAAVKEELKSLFERNPTRQEETELPIMDNSPPPPPTTRERPVHINNEIITRLGPLLEKRHRAYYQSLRHENLALALQNALQHETPKVPRKFFEKLGRFDQPAIIGKKIEMTRQNVLNEIEILRIYHDSDVERLNKFDEDIKNAVNELDESVRNEAGNFVDRSITKNVKISNNVIKKKLTFINSDKYLHPLNDINFEKLQEIKKPAKHNFNKRDSEQINNNSFNHDNFNNNYRAVSQINGNRKPTYSHTVQHPRCEQFFDRNESNFDSGNNRNSHQNFQLRNQNFRKRSQFVL